MRLPFTHFFSLLAGAAVLSSACAASVATNSDKPLSERVVAYSIDARVDAQHKTLDATETLTYHNLTGQAQDTFPFHLYLNAFQPKSTFMREVRRDHPDFEWEDKYRASAEVKSLQVPGIGDLTPQIHFIAPDDGNRDDRTVFQVKLPRAVKPGEDVYQYANGHWVSSHTIPSARVRWGSFEQLAESA